MRFSAFILLLLIGFNVFAQEGPTFSIYLIGDAGEDTASGKALLMLKDEIIKDPQSAIIFLGDNVYPVGFNPNDINSAKRLNSQLSILKTYEGSAYFIPGNHDWNAQKRKGLEKIIQQERYVNSYVRNATSVKNRNDAVFLPSNGLPGPSSVMLTEDVRLVILDTQWFLHFHKKNKDGSIKKTKKMFYLQLDSLLAYSKLHDQQVVIAAHHPMYTNGEHARKIMPLRFLISYTPFRIFGLFGLRRFLSQDLSETPYKNMREKMLEIFNRYDNIIYVSGHDHNVQCFREIGNRYIVSGNGSKRSRLLKTKTFNSIFQDDSTMGFVKLEFGKDKRLITKIYRAGIEVKVLEGY
jgi:calcineurin-like phosphoesterase family protein